MVISILNECLGQRAGGGRTNDVRQLTQATAPVLVHPFLANKQLWHCSKLYSYTLAWCGCVRACVRVLGVHA